MKLPFGPAFGRVFSRSGGGAGARAFGRSAVKGVNYATSPLLASKTPQWRSRFVVALVGAGFVGLLGRAAWIQLIAPGFYQEQGMKRYSAVVERPASRGRIVDRGGALLATSVLAHNVWANPSEFEATPLQRAQAARLLGMDPREFDARVAGNPAAAGGSAPSFAWVRRQVAPEVWQQVKALNIHGLYESRASLRRYPEGEAAAHVVGFTNLDDEGQEGVELAFEKSLQGKKGLHGVVKDRLGRVVEDLGVDVDAADGQDVVLSIDAKVQFIAYQRLVQAVQEHKAKAASAVVLDAQTGEILALANVPSFDPADRSRLTGEQLRNRALTDVFEPGSTMKPFVVAQALETKRVRPDTMINASAGSLQISGFTIKDAHPYGGLTVQQVIQKSSNIGTVRMAMQMSSRELWEVFNAVGYGRKPQIDFRGAASGKLRPYKSWQPIEQATMAYGYGLNASLLQIARAYTTFARDGEVIPVSLMRQGQPPQGQRVFSPETAREVRKMLQLAAGPGGTGQLAQTVGYSVGGKSGTAHKQEGKGYASHKYRSWFVGLAPVDKPRLIVAVMVDEPSNGQYFGGAVAAPVFSQVVQQTLRMMNVPPDLDVRSQLVTRAAEAAAPETVQ